MPGATPGYLDGPPGRGRGMGMGLNIGRDLGYHIINDEGFVKSIRANDQNGLLDVGVWFRDVAESRTEARASHSHVSTAVQCSMKHIKINLFHNLCWRKPPNDQKLSSSSETGKRQRELAETHRRVLVHSGLYLGMTNSQFHHNRSNA